MKIADTLLIDFDVEMEKTRSYLQLFPEDKATWKAHEKSTSLGEIAKHIAVLPTFGASFFTTDSMDLSNPQRPKFDYVDKADILSTFAAASAKLREVLAAASDEFAMSDWAYKRGDEVISTAPRALMYRVMFTNHLLHHRAQYGVYLRLLDVPLPGLYGPSADEDFHPDTAALDKLVYATGRPQ